MWLWQRGLWGGGKQSWWLLCAWSHCSTVKSCGAGDAAVVLVTALNVVIAVGVSSGTGIAVVGRFCPVQWRHAVVGCDYVFLCILFVPPPQASLVSIQSRRLPQSLHTIVVR